MPEIRNPNLQTQGPGGSGGGDLRSTLAFTMLMIVVFLGYQYFFNKPKPESTEPAPQSQSQTQLPASTTSQQTQSQSTTGAAQASPSAPIVAAAVVTKITLENEKYSIVITNRGGQVEHWILKNYFDTAGKPLDLVQPQTSAQFGLPLSLFTYEPALTTELNQALYQVSTSGAPPSATGLVVAPNSITFHYAANGLDVVKTFSFDSSYVIDVHTEVKRNGAPVRALVQWPAGLGDMEEFLPASLTRSQVPVSASSLFAWSIDGKQDTLKAKSVSGNATLDLPYQYAAITDLYFAAAFLPYAPDRVSVVTLHHSIELPGNLSDPNSQKRPGDVIGLAMGDTSGDTHLRLFAGPKDTDLLNSIHATGPDGKATGPSLESLIQFGWLTVIAKPLYIALRFLRGQLGSGINNWGWAIIIVTVIINMLMLPTRIMMMRSSMKMMRIQPKVEALKKRYAHLKINDPKKAEMNTEMMQLYKE